MSTRHPWKEFQKSCRPLDPLLTSLPGQLGQGSRKAPRSPQKGCEQQQSSLTPRALRMAFFSLKRKVASDSQSPGGAEGWGAASGWVFTVAQKKELILKGVKSTRMDASPKASVPHNMESNTGCPKTAVSSPQIDRSLHIHLQRSRRAFVLHLGSQCVLMWRGQLRDT